MIRALFGTAESYHWAELALILFVLTFGVILAWALLMPRQEVETLSSLPLQDEEEEARHV